MTRGKDFLSDEAVILHSCFYASRDEIMEFIQPYQYKRTLGGEFALEQVQQKGNRTIWWNISPKGISLDENKPPQSKIDILHSKNLERKITEVKITCSHHPLLYNFFENLSENLWRTFEEIDDYEHILPDSGEPMFKSLVDLLNQRDLSNKEYLEAFPDVDDDSPILSEQTKKQFSRDDLPKKSETIAKWQKAYAIIVDRRKAYLEEFKDNISRKRSPTLKDYQDAIVSDLNLPYCEKTVSKIKKAGDDGLLN